MLFLLKKWCNPWNYKVCNQKYSGRFDTTVNETGDMFMIDWTYNGYCFAVYGKSPQNTSDRDMAGKIALAMIYNLGEVE